MTISSIYSKITSLAWRNVVRNWRHSRAALITISCGFVANAVLQGFIANATEETVDNFSLRGMFADVLIVREGAQLDQPSKLWKAAMGRPEQEFVDKFLHNDPDVLYRARFLTVAGLANAGNRSAIYFGVGHDVIEGEKIRTERFKRNVLVGDILAPDRPGIVTGIGLGARLGCEGGYLDRAKARLNVPETLVGNLVPLKCAESQVSLTATTENSSINQIDLPVMGLTDAGLRDVDDRVVFMTLPDAQKLMNTDKITFFTVKLKPGANEGAFRRRFSEAANAAGFKLQAPSWRNYGQGAELATELDLLKLLNAVFGTIMATMCVMAITSTMMKTVTERTREIGTLRSMGFLRQHIVYMFCAEGGFISLIACMIGLVVTIFISKGIAAANMGFTAGLSQTAFPVRVTETPLLWALSIIILTVLTIVTSSLTARRAANKVIADAMRHA
jgi:putative ABC transport system permease protein